MSRTGGRTDKGDFIGPTIGCWRTKNILANVPQESIGKLCDVRIFADDTSILKVLDTPELTYQSLKHDLGIYKNGRINGICLLNLIPQSRLKR